MGTSGRLPVKDVHNLNAAAVLLAYVVASVSAPYWIARRAGVDLRVTGSRKLGGSNLWRTVGPIAGVVGGMLDAGKGFVAVLAASAAGLGTETALACGVAAVAGQMWPVFHRFDGGRANATGWGFALAADPAAAVAMGIPVVAAAAMRLATRPRSSRIVPVAALASFAVWPGVIWEQQGLTATVVAGIVVFALVLVRRVTADLRDDLATGAPAGRVLWNRAMFDRSELQERGLIPL
ncbi:MAG TPA: glycerol-3-phosphate acyltransferase [Candidatus Limnocylindria bacterium]|nr:glycerol-3-phosphate acyltransferase [Candidatus Limnocylindria bacterium]